MPGRSPGVLAAVALLAAGGAVVGVTAAPAASAAVSTGVTGATHSKAELRALGRTRTASDTGRVALPSLPSRIKRVCDWSPALRPACTALLRARVPGHIGLYARGAAPKGYGPGDLRQAYRLPAGSLGSGETVAVISAFGYPKAESDLAVYRKQFGLPPCGASNNCFRKVNQNGKESGYPKPEAQFSESQALDLDMVSAICPSCKILLVEAIDSFPNLAASVDTARRLGALFIVNDYEFDDTGPGTNGHPDNSKYVTFFNHPGVVMTAGGTGGYQYPPGVVEGYNGMFLPAAFPKVTAVGITTLSRAKNRRHWKETAWMDSASGCSDGFGVSWRKPPWQSSDACDGLKVNVDVAAVGNPLTGVATYDTFGPSGWQVGGGAGVASAIIASVYALAGRPAPGTFPASYPYVQSSHLFDIRSGSNLITTSLGDCNPKLLCHAGPGYDGPTGHGSPDGLAAFTPPLTVDYVAMGDSYIAGEGNAPYFEGSNTRKDQCHRSTRAYPTLVTLPGQSVPIATTAKDGDKARFAFIACSGAETTGITADAVFASDDDEKKWNANGNTDWGKVQSGLTEGLQADRPAGLNAGTTLVTLSIGGNDARFSDVLTGCLIKAARKVIPLVKTDCADANFRLKRILRKGSPVDPQDLDQFEPKVIFALRAHLASTYNAIHAKAPHAEIIVTGYPLFFKAHPTKTCLLGTVAGVKIPIGLRAGDQKRINIWGTELDASVKAAVEQVRSHGVNIRYVDPVAAFAGHELCSSKPWIMGVKGFYIGPAGFKVADPGSFHPTLAGEEQYAHLVNGCLAGTISC